MFPGQGSQYAGMGSDFLEENSRFDKYLEIASGYLKKDLKKIICDVDSMGSLLDDTRFSQIAIFCVSSAINDHLLDDCRLNRNKIIATIGHSLGDYSALYCSGAFDFYGGSRLVVFRGNLMGSLTEIEKIEEDML